MRPEQLFFLLSTLTCLSSLYLTCWLHHQHFIRLEVPPAPPDPAGPLVSVIIPARDEARNIGACVAALLAQTHSHLELLVVDDRSTDATPRILAEVAARDVRLRVLPGASLPPGWAGKAHALHQGAQAARGEWLCFVDADTFAGPDLLAGALAAAREQQADLLTLLTAQELGSFWEKVIMPVVFTGLAVGFPADRVNDPSRPEAVANGQFILIRRSVYDAVGGHAALRGSIVEDKALAERVKRAGHRLVLGDGRALVRTRMYTSLAELWEGWTKNIFLGLRDRQGLLLFGAVVAAAGAFFLPLWLGAALAWLAWGGGGWALGAAAEALLVWAAVVYVRARLAQAFGISAWYGFSLPLGALMFAGMMLDSTLRVLSGHGVTWKGRRYGGR